MVLGPNPDPGEMVMFSMALNFATVESIIYAMLVMDDSTILDDNMKQLLRIIKNDYLETESEKGPQGFFSSDKPVIKPNENGVPQYKVKRFVTATPVNPPRVVKPNVNMRELNSKSTNGTAQDTIAALLETIIAPGRTVMSIDPLTGQLSVDAQIINSVTCQKEIDYLQLVAKQVRPITT
jgi:hypothetical protein